MIDRRLTRLTLALALAIALLSSAAVAPVAADHDSEHNLLDEILDESADEDEGLVDRAKGLVPDYIVDGMAIFDGQLQRFYAGIGNPFADNSATNEEYSAAFAEAVAENNDTYAEFLTTKTTPSENYSTHRITFAHEDSEPHTVYLVGSVANDSYEGVTVLSEAEYNESEQNHTASAEWVVVGDAAGEFGELTTELAERIEDDRDIDRTTRAQLVGRYCDVGNPMGDAPADESCDIRSTLWMDHDTIYHGVTTNDT